VPAALFMTTRPFRILGVQQIAIGATDKRRLRRLWVDLLGLEPVGQFQSQAENVEEDILRVGQGVWGVEIDLMQPLDTQRKPRVDEPALNHIGLWVDDLKAAHAWLTQHGVRFAPGGIRPGAGGHDVCFIHPKGDAGSPVGGEGVLIELVQAPPSLLEQLRDE
jgi:lactoylglutathione lyase